MDNSLDQNQPVGQQAGKNQPFPPQQQTLTSTFGYVSNSNTPPKKSFLKIIFTIFLALAVLISMVTVMFAYGVIPVGSEEFRNKVADMVMKIPFMPKNNQSTSNGDRESKPLPITNINQNTQSPSAKGEWKGIIWAENGFIKIDSNGMLENQKFNPVLPKGMSPEYIDYNFTGISNLGDDIFKNAFQVLNDGRIIFIGSREISTADKEDTLYSWKIGSLENPKPEFTLENGQKVERFIYSPDNKYIALISVTLYAKNIYEELGDIKTTSLKIVQVEIEKRDKKLSEELKIITIFDVNTKKPIKILKIDKKDEQSNRLAWKGNYLYVFDNFMFRVFDMSTYEVVYTSGKSGTGPIGDGIIISPDGTKYIDVSGQLVKVIPTNENLISFETSTDVSAFSLDSKKLLVEKTTVYGQAPGDVDVVAFGEVDLEAGKLKMIGAFESLIDGLKLGASKEVWGYFAPMAVYNPAGDVVIFTMDTQGSGTVYSTDIYALHIGETKAKGNNLKISLGTARDVAFMGWYKE